MELVMRTLLAVALAASGSLGAVTQPLNPATIAGGAGRVVASPTAPVAVTFFDSRLAQDSEAFTGNGLAILDLTTREVLVGLKDNNTLLLMGVSDATAEDSTVTAFKISE